MQKSLRIQTAKDTLAEVKQGFYMNDDEKVDIYNEAEFAKKNTIFYKSDELQKILHDFTPTHPYNTIFQVINCSTIQAIIQLHENNTEKIGVLNFASAKNPGGGVLSGAQAQEESLARSSALYPCLVIKNHYYDIHRATHYEINGEIVPRTALYTDNMMYSPQVPFFKNDKGKYFSKPICVDVLTSPAVNAGVVRRQEQKNAPLIEQTLTLRMEKMLALFAKNECVDLILGAWGCGVFQNNPQEIATLFEKTLKHTFKNTFRKIVFAIYSDEDKMINPFQKAFGN